MAERPNYTGSGRTIMTAPIRPSQAAPERDAPRATGQGLSDLGRGLSQMASAGYQAASHLTQQKKTFAEQLKQNQTKDLMYSVDSFVRKELPRLVAEDPELGDLTQKTPEELQELMPKVQALYASKVSELRAKFPQADFSPEHEAQVFDSGYAAPIQNHVLEQDSRIKVQTRVANITDAAVDRLSRIPAPVVARDFDGIVFNLKTEIAAIDGEDSRYISPIDKNRIKYQLRAQATDIYRAAAMQANPSSLSLVSEKIDAGFKAGVYDAHTQAQLKAVAQRSAAVGKEEKMGGMQQAAEVALQAVRDGTVSGEAVTAAVAQYVDAKQYTATAGGTKELTPEATNRFIREGAFAVLSASSNRLLQNAVPSVLTGTSLLPQAVAGDMLAAYDHLAVVFPEGNPQLRRENFLKYVNETKVFESMRSLGVDKAFEEVTDKEIDGWVSEIMEQSRKRVALATSGRANELVENLPEMRNLGPNATGAQIMDMMEKLQAQAGVPEAYRKLVPSFVANGLLQANKNQDRAAVQQQLLFLGKEFGGHALDVIESLASAGADGKPRLSALYATAFAYALSPFTHIGRGKLGSKTTNTINLNWQAMAAVYNYENNKKNIEKYGDAVKLARGLLFNKGSSDGALTAGMYLAAAGNDLRAPKTMREGTPDFMDALLLEQIMGPNASQSPQDAVDRTFNFLANSFLPIRSGTIDDPSYTLQNANRYSDEWQLQITKGQGFTNRKELMETIGAVTSDLPFYGTPDPEAEQASWAFQVRRSLAYNLHVFNKNPTVYGEASDMLTQRPLLTTSQLSPYIPSMNKWLGAAGTLQDNVVMKAYGAQNLDFNDFHVKEGGKLEPLNPRFDPKLYPWRPEQVGQRAYAILQGTEGAAASTRVRVVVGQNRFWHYNSDLDAMQLMVKSKSVGNPLLGRVPQSGSYTPVYYGNGKPVAVPMSDINRAVESFRTSTLQFLRI